MTSPRLRSLPGTRLWDCITKFQVVMTLPVDQDKQQMTLPVLPRGRGMTHQADKFCVQEWQHYKPTMSQYPALLESWLSNPVEDQYESARSEGEDDISQFEADWDLDVTTSSQDADCSYHSMMAKRIRRRNRAKWWERCMNPWRSTMREWPILWLCWGKNWDLVPSGQTGQDPDRSALLYF